MKIGPFLSFFGQLVARALSMIKIFAISTRPEVKKVNFVLSNRRYDTTFYFCELHLKLINIWRILSGQPLLWSKSDIMPIIKIIRLINLHLFGHCTSLGARICPEIRVWLRKRYRLFVKTKTHLKIKFKKTKDTKMAEISNGAPLEYN